MGVATADLIRTYPFRIVEQIATDGGNLFTSASNAWSVGASLMQPILMVSPRSQAPCRNRRFKAANANYEQTSCRHSSRLPTAWKRSRMMRSS